MTKRLLTNSLIFFLGTMVFSVFNYLYNAFMGRFLGPAQYSILGSLIAFISIITIPTNAVATVAMRFAAYYHAKGEDGAIRTFFESLTKRLGSLGLLVAFAIVAISSLLTNFLHLPSSTPVILIAPLMIFAILIPLNRGILQGLQNFTAAIINQNIDPFIKLVLGITLVKLGFGINGAVGAIVIGATVAYLLSYLPLSKIRNTKRETIQSIPDEVKQYSAVALIAFLLATILMNIDILLVKHYMPAREAGLYAALSTIGKIILFVTTPVVSVMFPMISDLQGRDEKHYRILGQSFILVTFIAVCGVIGYYLFPKLVVTILYGAEYLEIAPLLGIFGITMLLYSLINLWVNYFLSIGNKLFVAFLALGVIAEISLLLVRHGTFREVIDSLLLAMTVGFIGLTAYYIYLKWPRLTELIVKANHRLVES